MRLFGQGSGSGESQLGEGRRDITHPYWGAEQSGVDHCDGSV